MRTQRFHGLELWFSVIAVIMMLWGAYFALFGFGAFPIDRAILLRWESAIYGAMMIGWGATLFLVGRMAFQRRDPGLMRALLAGVVLWLVIEAAFSARLRVWFNVGVDLAVLALLGLPLAIAIRRAGKTGLQTAGPGAGGIESVRR